MEERKKIIKILVVVFLFFLVRGVYAGECGAIHDVPNLMPLINVSFGEEVILNDFYLENAQGVKTNLESFPQPFDYSKSFELSPTYNLVIGYVYNLFLNYSDDLGNSDFMNNYCFQVTMPQLDIQLTKPEYHIFNSINQGIIEVVTDRQTYKCKVINLRTKAEVISDINKITDNIFRSEISGIDTVFNDYNNPIFGGVYENLYDYNIQCLEGDEQSHSISNLTVKLGYDITKPTINVYPDSSSNTYPMMNVRFESSDDEVVCRYDEKNLNYSFEEMRYEVTSLEDKEFVKSGEELFSQDSSYKLSSSESKTYKFTTICMNRAKLYSNPIDFSFTIDLEEDFEIKDIIVYGSLNSIVGDSQLSVGVATTLDLESNCDLEVIPESDGISQMIERDSFFIGDGNVIHNFSETDVFKPGNNKIVAYCEDIKGVIKTKESFVYYDDVNPVINKVSVSNVFCDDSVSFKVNYTEDNPRQLIYKLIEVSTSQKIYEGSVGYPSMNDRIKVNNILMPDLQYKLEITVVDDGKNYGEAFSNVFSYLPLAENCKDNSPPDTDAEFSLEENNMNIKLKCEDQAEPGRDNSGCMNLFYKIIGESSCPPNDGSYYDMTDKNPYSMSVIENELPDEKNEKLLCFFSMDNRENKEEPEKIDLYVKKLELLDIEDDQDDDKTQEDNLKGQDADEDGMDDGWESQNGFDFSDPFNGWYDPDLDGCMNLYEFYLGTDPNINDTDGDGRVDCDFCEIGNDNDSDMMCDNWELVYGLDINDPTDALLDSDGDGLINLIEYRYGTDPFNEDTDFDMLTDYDEVMEHNTVPTEFDTDLDKMPDGYEIDKEFNPLDVHDGYNNSDNDGLYNLEEYIHITDPFIADTDKDGIIDGGERTSFTSAIILHETPEDKDGDKIGDKYEVTYGLNPSNPKDKSNDLDGDGLEEYQEYIFKLNLNSDDTDNDEIGDYKEIFDYKTFGYKSDTDDDGWDDIREIESGSDPLDPRKYPESFLDNDNDGVPKFLDCDDENAKVNQLLAEDCTDLIDNDCNGLLDCYDPYCSNNEVCRCTPGSIRECGQSNVGECKKGNQTCNETLLIWNFLECDGLVEPKTEDCFDDKDNDCDGNISCKDGDCLGNINAGCPNLYAKVEPKSEEKPPVKYEPPKKDDFDFLGLFKIIFLILGLLLIIGGLGYLNKEYLMNLVSKGSKQMKSQGLSNPSLNFKGHDVSNQMSQSKPQNIQPTKDEIDIENLRSLQESSESNNKIYDNQQQKIPQDPTQLMQNIVKPNINKNLKFRRKITKNNLLKRKDLIKSFGQKSNALKGFELRSNFGKKEKDKIVSQKSFLGSEKKTENIVNKIVKDKNFQDQSQQIKKSSEVDKLDNIITDKKIEPIKKTSEIDKLDSIISNKNENFQINKLDNLMIKKQEGDFDRLGKLVEQSSKPHSGVEQSSKPHSGVEQSSKPHSGVEQSSKPHSGVEQSSKSHSGIEEALKKTDKKEIFNNDKIQKQKQEEKVDFDELVNLKDKKKKNKKDAFDDLRDL